MGFGSSAASMITILKNNKKLLRGRKHFDNKSLGGYGEYRKTEYALPEATPQVLSEIRQKLERQREIFQRKALIIGILFVMLAIILLNYLG